jgi:hypothetical protein
MNTLLGPRSSFTRRDFLHRGALGLGAAMLLRGRTFAADAPAGQRVFVTAHSFHNFVGQRLGTLAKAAGIEGHELVGLQMIGGSKTIQHWDLADDKNKAKPALAEGKVDVLTMSPHMTYTPDDGIDHFVELGNMHNPKMRFMVQQSWPIFDGWLPEEKIAKVEDRDTRPLDIVRVANQRFHDALATQIADLNKKLGREAVFLVPAGDAIMKLRDLIAAGKAPGLTKQTDLFNDLIGHGKLPLVALTTYCNFACIYRMSPVGLKDNEPGLDQLSPELKPLLQQIAWSTVTAEPQSGVKA